MRNEKFTCTAIIVAAGQGKRMGASINKQFLRLGNKPVLAHTLEKFESCQMIQDIIVVTSKAEMEICHKQIIQAYGYRKVKQIVEGGKERQNSVYNGIQYVDPNTDILVVHDGARPFIEIEHIEKSIQGAVEQKACVVGVRIKDTIKICNTEQYIVDTPERNLLWSIQTPQTFQYSLLLKAHQNAIKEGFLGTDDAVLVERDGIQVKVVEGSYENIKITTPEDLLFGEVILKNQKHR